MDTPMEHEERKIIDLQMAQRSREAGVVHTSITQDTVEETTPSASPLARPGESEEGCIRRVLHEGTAEECLIESTYWLGYYLATENADLEPISTAMELIERAMALLERKTHVPNS